MSEGISPSPQFLKWKPHLCGWLKGSHNRVLLYYGQIVLDLPQVVSLCHFSIIASKKPTALVEWMPIAQLHQSNPPTRPPAHFPLCSYDFETRGTCPPRQNFSLCTASSAIIMIARIMPQPSTGRQREQHSAGLPVFFVAKTTAKFFKIIFNILRIT